MLPFVIATFVVITGILTYLISPVIFAIVTYIRSPTSLPSPATRSSYRSRLSGQIVWITGATSGIGEQLAYAFAECGCRCIISGRSKSALDAVISGIHSATPSASVTAVPFDLAEAASDDAILSSAVKSALRVYGDRLDILILNAGVSVRGDMLSLPINVVRSVFEVNFFANLSLARAVIPTLTKASRAVIAVTSSVQSVIPVGRRSAYASSKAAVESAFECLRYELPDNVHVSLVCPGYVNTNLSEKALTANGTAGVKDANSSNGMSAEVIAWRYVEAVVQRRRTVILADFKTHFAAAAARLWPELIYSTMRKRSEAEKAAAATASK